MCTDADHAQSDERELLGLLREQVLGLRKLLKESEQTNKLLMALVDAMAGEMDEATDDDQPQTYLDGSPIR